MDEFERFLVAMTRACGARDPDAFAALIALPLALITGGGTEMVLDAARLRGGFEAYLAALDAEGVTEVARVATSATAVAPQLLACTYEARMTHAGAPAGAPQVCAVHLRRDAGGWRATSFTNPILLGGGRFAIPSAPHAAHG